MIDCDEVFTEASALGTVATVLDCYGNQDTCKDCGMGWIFMSALVAYGMEMRNLGR